MRAYWITFTDGSEGCCEGQSDYDVRRIAEHVTGKKISIPSSAVAPLPYPASPLLWQFDHPVVGKTPPFCYEPRKCAGKSSCPQRRSCTE